MTNLPQTLLTEANPTGGIYDYYDALRPEDDAFDFIWTQAEADSSDFIEYKVPASTLDSSGNPVVRAEKADGDTITNPLNGVDYTIRIVEEEYTDAGQVNYHYVAFAPHYELGYIPAIPYNTENGTTLRALLDCLQQVSQGWSFSGDGCVAWAGDSRCPAMDGPQFSSKRASVLTQLMQAAQTWGGHWTFDEINKTGYLSCDLGGSSGVVADWKVNLRGMKRHRENKPRQQVLVQESPNGTLTGVSAQMALAELEAAEACDQYLQTIANQSKTNQGDLAPDQATDPCSDPCAMIGHPLVTLVSSTTMSAARDYQYEAFLLEQAVAISYEAGVLELPNELSLLGGPGRINISESLRIVQPEIGIDDVVRCVQRTYNLLEPEKTTFQFSTEVPWITIALQPPPPPPSAQAVSSSIPKAGGTARGKDDNCRDCADNPVGVSAEWIPPPRCLGQADKLRIALQDKIDQLNHIVAIATNMTGHAFDATTSMENVIRSLPDGGFVSSHDLFQGLGDISCKLQQAIIEAELQVIEAEDQLIQAEVIAGNESLIDLGGKSCGDIGSAETVNSGLGGGDSGGGSGTATVITSIEEAIKASKKASDAIDHGHWVYATRQASVPAPGCSSSCTDPTSLGVDSALASAAKAVISAACNFSRTDLNTIKKHFHQNCGDISTDTEVPNADGSTLGGPSSSSTLSLADAQAVMAKVIFLKQQSDLIDAQIQRIHETDAAIEKLHQNVKECTAAADKGIGELLANCMTEGPISQNAPGDGPSGGDGSGAGGGGGAPTPEAGAAAVFPARGAAPGPATDASSLGGPGGDGNCFDHAISIARAVLKAAGSLQGMLGAIGDAVTDIDTAHIAAAAALTETPTPDPDDPGPPDTAADAPGWNIDAAAIVDGLNSLRGSAATVAGDATTIIQDLQAFTTGTAGLADLTAGWSDAVDANDPQQAAVILAAKAAKDSAMAARSKLNQDMSLLTVDALVLHNQWLQANTNADAIDQAIDNWMRTVGSYQMDVEIQSAALAELADVPIFTARLEEAIRQAASFEGSIGKQIPDLLDGVDCADSYLVTLGVDVNQQHQQNELVQNTWIAITPQTLANSYNGFPYDRTFPSGAHALFVSEDEPSLPSQDGDLWVKARSGGSV